MIPTLDPLDSLRARLTTAPLEPIYDTTYSDHISECEPWDWGSGGRGRVLEQMDSDTDPRPRRSDLLRSREAEQSRAVLRALRGGPTH